MAFYGGVGTLVNHPIKTAVVADDAKYTIELFNGGVDPMTRAEVTASVGMMLYISMFGGLNACAKIIKVAMPPVLDPPPTFIVTIDSAISIPTSSFDWRIVDISTADIKRTVDYKIQADSKNYFFFANSDEWIVYHSFNLESYYGNRFYPTMGAVVCYDENDAEIHPSDIIFCPECISDGVFEGAKVIIKWPALQSGKVCFNPGFSADEKYDQSRLIMPITSWTANSTGYVAHLSSAVTRSTSIVTTEPYMTVDAIDNGNIVKYGLIAYERESGKIGSYGAVVRIKATRRFFNTLDAKVINSTDVNTDILNVITFKFNQESEVFGATGLETFLSTYQESTFRTRSGFYYIDPTDYFTTVPSSIDLDYYTSSGMFIDNIGYSYDPAGIYRISYYLHGKPSGSTDVNFGDKFFSDGPSLKNFSGTIVGGYEQYRPMIKVHGVDGYFKLVGRRREFAMRTTSDGFVEAEYLIEFPSTLGSYSFRSNIHYYTDFNDSMYQNTQIMYPNSMVKEGGYVQEKSYRVRALDDPNAFTYLTLMESDFDLATYRRNVGGYEISKGLLGKPIINYPSNVVYRKVVPNRIHVLSDNSYEVEILSGSDGSGHVINPNKDMKLFILYSNKKWRYDKDKFESYSGRENPTYVFEIDSTALLQNFSSDMAAVPSLPDLKRWFTAYCRGFAHMTSVTGDRVDPIKSNSEMCLDVWDNVTNNWRNTSASKYDDLVHTTPYASFSTYFVGLNGSGNIILADNTANYAEIPKLRVNDWVRIGPVFGNIYRITADTGYDNTLGYWNNTYSTDIPVIEAGARGSGAAVQAFYADPYISNSRIFKIFPQTIVSFLTGIRRFFDLKTETNRYISDGKIYFRLRIMKARSYPIRKDTIDLDTFKYENPWSDSGEFDPDLVGKTEDIKTLGLDYFKVESV